MKNVYMLELYFSGDTYVFETAEMARDFAIQKTKEYCINMDEDYEEAIIDIKLQYEKYDGELDTDYVNCTRVPFIMKGE